MAYVINKWDGSEHSVIQDGTLDLTLDIRLVGKNYAGYGEIQNESFLHMLENFSGIAAPPNAIKGQIWYDSAEKKLKVFTGDVTGTGAKVWKSLNAAQIGETAPPTPSTGEMWFDLSVDQLKVWLGTEWIAVGPQNAGEGITQMVSRQIKDSQNQLHQIICATIGNEVVGIFSKDTFAINVSDLDSKIVGFDIGAYSNIKRGFNLPYTSPDGDTQQSSNTIMWGTASNALRLNGRPAADYENLLAGNFASVASFSDSGFTVGLLDKQFKISVAPQNDIILESLNGYPIKFLSKKSNNDITNPLTITEDAVIPGDNNVFNLGSMSGNPRIWKNVYAESFKGVADKADQLKVGSEYRLASVNASLNTIVVRDNDGAITSPRLIGNADTATKLETPRTINGTSFDGSANIIITDGTKLPLVGGTLTGALNLHAHPSTTLNQDPDAVGNKQAATKYYVDNKFGTAGILPLSSGGTGAGTEENARENLNVPTRTGGDASGTWNIGINGNAATASKATHIAGGVANSLVYQSNVDTTAFLNIGNAGEVLTSNGTALSWAAVTGLAAGSSALIATSSINSGDEYRILFKNGTQNNNSNVYFDTDFKYNAGTNTLTTNVKGKLNGNIVLDDGITNVLTVAGTAAASLFAGTSEKAKAFDSNRTVSLTGVVTGTSIWDGSGNLSITTSIGSSNVITLGTNTEGNYVERLTAGTHILLNEGVSAYSPGEGDNITITVDATPGLSFNKIVSRDENGNFTAATITATLFDGVAAQARYADLAEKYLPDQEYEPGTVVSVGGEKEITACVWGDRALGVISTNPAYMMNKDLEGGAYVALKGRVPCKVIGSVRKGQRLIAANDGVAVAAVPHSNDVFAIALESSDDAGIKVIEVAVL